MKTVERIQSSNEFGIDIAVLCIFFCREEQFGQVFAEVKKAKPSRLYLYQDGPRTNRKGEDCAGIEKCRLVAESIDWKCEVHKWYQESNIGCDPSEYLAQKWMFETEEMGIVLEDDDVPARSFFEFCKELLDKYKNDERISAIMGMNNMGVYENTEASYLFTNRGSIWGWASWRRVLDSWDPQYKWLDDPKALEVIKKNMKFGYRDFIKTAKKHRETGVEHYETIFGAARWLEGALCIVPKYNMITNVGLTSNSTHSVDDMRLLPRSVQQLYHMQRYEIDFPLIHPNKVVLHRDFERFFRYMKGNKIELLFRSLYVLGIRGTIERGVNKLRNR